MTAPAPRHVAIIGAGIVGVATALSLQRDGIAVTLIDRDGPGEGASFGNAGVLASASIVPVTVPGLPRKAPRMLLDRDSPLFLRWSYLPRLAPWLMRYLSHCRAGEVERIASALHAIIADSVEEHLALARGTPAARYIRPSDYLYVYRDRAAYQADAFGWNLRRAHGHRWEEMEREALAAYDAALGPACGFGARLGGHGHISDPGAYVKALAAHFAAEGGTLLRATVTDVIREAGRVTGLATSSGPLMADAVVLTAGAWSGPLAKALGVTVPLESERGYHVELVEPSAMPRVPCMIAAGKFVATPMEGRIRLAGIVEFGGLDAPPSRRPFELLVEQFRRAMPGITWRETRQWMGHRPAPADSIPLIGAAPGLSGAFMGFGHHHVGLTGGPKTGRLLASMIAGRRPNLDLAPCDPARFAT